LGPRSRSVPPLARCLIAQRSHKARSCFNQTISAKSAGPPSSPVSNSWPPKFKSYSAREMSSALCLSSLHTVRVRWRGPNRLNAARSTHSTCSPGGRGQGGAVTSTHSLGASLGLELKAPRDLQVHRDALYVGERPGPIEMQRGAILQRNRLRMRGEW
ncbi:hypothetical protein BaRGS_00005181, partial [Batillaria attramentaria]